MADTIVVTQAPNPIIEVASPGPQGAVPYLDFVSGQYYRPQGSQTGAATATLNVVYYSQIFIPRTTTFDRIAIKSGSNFSGTGVVRLGIYATSNGKPSTLIADYGTVSVTALSTVYTITINQTLPTGFYWLAAVMQTAATTSTFSGNAGNIAAYQNYQNLPYDPTMGTGSVITGYNQAGVSGALATAVPVSTTINLSIVPFLRAL